MAPFGKIYSYPNNYRVNRVLLVAAMNGLEIELPPFTMRETNKTPEFLAKFPLGKVPAFEGADGFCLTESPAIAAYVAQAGPKAGQLLGTDPKTQALIQQWSAFSEGEMFSCIFPPIAMGVMNYMPMDEKRFNSSMADVERVFKRLEVALEGGKKYLVGDSLTLADIMVTGPFFLAFKHLIDAEMRKQLPNVVAYAQAFANVPEHKKLYGELEMCETRVKV
ncbi:glutathione S-transferase [Xylariaceae sp. FL1651]|nr:glutathione S-transferase [Xylariaceae sp. FL1651]